MINELSRRYLQELRAAQQQINSSSLKEETHSGTGHEVLETHTSEYNLELGPLKLNVKKSRTVTGKASILKKSTNALSKNELLTDSGSYSKEQIDAMRNLQSPESVQLPDYKKIDIII
ncbi:MAG: hypothetical protein NE327_13295 [Lentisphaeraceae bacterium]|nr:hypothetical protein [Lentisphaeraceae bacterium]